MVLRKVAARLQPCCRALQSAPGGRTARGL